MFEDEVVGIFYFISYYVFVVVAGELIVFVYGLFGELFNVIEEEGMLCCNGLYVGVLILYDVCYNRIIYILKFGYVVMGVFVDDVLGFGWCFDDIIGLAEVFFDEFVFGKCYGFDKVGG